MRVKFISLAVTLLLLFFGGGVFAQSYPVSRPSPQGSRTPPPQSEDLGSVLRQIKTGLADLKHSVNNHEIEIRTFEEKLHTQEASVEHLQQQVKDDLRSQRDANRTSQVNVEGKVEILDQSLQSLEGSVKGVIADLRQLKTQANESVAVLGQYKQKLSDLEKLIETQNLHMQNFESALQSMMEVIQVKAAAASTFSKSTDSDNPQIYKVQPGDSLERIAKAHKVSVQALRDANQLTNDRILVGQKLKIP